MILPAYHLIQLKNLFYITLFCLLLFTGKTFSYDSPTQVKDSTDAEDIIRKVIKKASDNHLADRDRPIYFKSHYKVNISPRFSGQDIDRSKIFYSERISDHQFKYKHQLNEKIIDQRTLGFEQPLNEVLATKIFSFNWFRSDFIFFNETYASPLSLNNLGKYEYQLLASRSDVYIVHFSSNRKGNFLEGNLIIDKKDHAIKNISIQHDKRIQILGSFRYEYKPSLEKWMPIDYFIQMKPGKGGKRFAIFSGLIDLGLLQKKSSLSDEETKSLTASIRYFDHQKRPNQAQGQDYYISLTDSTDTKNFKKISKLNYTDEEERLIRDFDSVNLSEKVKNNIYRVTRVNDGFLPVNLWNIDLKTLIKVNNFEGLRLGFGGQTNSRLSKRFRFGGYTAYGTKDENIKFGINTQFKVDKDKNTWLKLGYTDDVREVANSSYLTDERVYSLFEPRLVNIIFFFKERSSAIRLQSRLLPRLLSDFRISYDQIETTSDYRFLSNNRPIAQYNLNKYQASLRWMPNNKYLLANQKVNEVSKRSPFLSLQLTQAFGGDNGIDDFSFTKINFKVNYVKNWYSGAKTDVLLESNIAFGDVPLTHAYHAFPNNPVKGKLIERFSVAGVKSFETMFFNEFFSTRLAFLHFKHQLRPFHISDAIQPELVFISRHGIGDFKDRENHQGVDFSTMDKGFNEVGLELNKVYAGFGLSFAYRYGAYHLPDFNDNLSFKFTFYFNI